MKKNDYEIINLRGHTFYFKYDDDSPDMLHIYVRHLKDTFEAMDTFFNGTTTYNKKYKRYETTLESNGIYWLWLNEINKRVLIISCFTIGEKI